MERSHSALVTDSVEMTWNICLMLGKKLSSVEANAFDGVSSAFTSSDLPCHFTDQQWSSVSRLDGEGKSSPYRVTRSAKLDDVSTLECSATDDGSSSIV